MKTAIQKIEFVVNGLLLLVIFGGASVLVAVFGPGWALLVATLLAVAILFLMILVMSGLSKESISDTVRNIIKFAGSITFSDFMTFVRLKGYGLWTPRIEAVCLSDREFSLVRLLARCLAHPDFCREQIVDITGGEWFAELIMRTPSVETAIHMDKRSLSKGEPVVMAKYRDLAAVYLGRVGDELYLFYPRSTAGIEFVEGGTLFDEKIRIGRFDRSGEIILMEGGLS